MHFESALLFKHFGNDLFLMFSKLDFSPCVSLPFFNPISDHGKIKLKRRGVCGTKGKTKQHGCGERRESATVDSAVI